MAKDIIKNLIERQARIEMLGKRLPKYWTWGEDGKILELTKDNNWVVHDVEEFIDIKLAVWEKKKLMKMLGLARMPARVA